MSAYDPWPYSGKTYLFDVQAALQDPDRDRRAESGQYWELVDTAAIAHESGASSMLVKLDEKGRPMSQQLVLFGGTCGARPSTFECNRATVEMIDFQEPNPRWVRQEPLIQEATQLLAVTLPHGKVLLIGGVLGRGTPPAGWSNSFHYQRFDPEDGSSTPLVETNLPTHDHATILLLPDGSVIRMGGNRTDFAYFTGPGCAEGSQCSNQATQDSGVPVAQVYQPPYFFHGDRPRIEKMGDKISYRQRFVVKVAGGSGKIGSVAMIQQHPQTHNHIWNRYVQLWFQEEDGGKVIAQAPALPGVAPPGYYLLFVISDADVPSEGKLVHIAAEVTQSFSIAPERGVRQSAPGN